MGEDSLLERVTAAAEERQLSHNSLIANRRTWLKIIAWRRRKASSSESSHQKGLRSSMRRQPAAGARQLFQNPHPLTRVER
jgi:hypothetical protein